jgi:predicted  nucleic acid-binding Zn-ribbon protein
MKEPDESLRLQKEITELKNTIDDLNEAIRDRDLEIVGLKKVVCESRSQVDKLAMILGVQSDYPTILGEMEKLIHVEDDVEILRGQVRSLKSGDKEEIGKMIIQGEKAVKKMKKIVVELNKEIQLLRARRNVDKYKTVELIKETIKRFFKGLSNSFMKFPRFIFAKVRR